MYKFVDMDDDAPDEADDEEEEEEEEELEEEEEEAAEEEESEGEGEGAGDGRGKSKLRQRKVGACAPTAGEGGGVQVEHQRYTAHCRGERGRRLISVRGRSPDEGTSTDTCVGPLP